MAIPRAIPAWLIHNTQISVGSSTSRSKLAGDQNVAQFPCALFSLNPLFSSSVSLPFFSDFFLPPGVFETVGEHLSLHRRTTGIATSLRFSLFCPTWPWTVLSIFPDFLCLRYMMMVVGGKTWSVSHWAGSPCCPISSPMVTLWWTWSSNGRTCWQSWSLR